MTARKQLFISSVQKELVDERRALKEYVHGDPLMRRFFEVFLFEDLPASDRRADEVYLHEVERSAIYVGLFGNDYGYQDAEGISPTERELASLFVPNTARPQFWLSSQRACAMKRSGSGVKSRLNGVTTGASTPRIRRSWCMDLSSNLRAPQACRWETRCHVRPLPRLARCHASEVTE